MITIHVHNLKTCAAAIEWCKKNVLDSTWQLNTRWPAAGIDFLFKNTKDATIFSLKWVNS
jgi:hypothetical protein